jgi:hypothetical protein
MEAEREVIDLQVSSVWEREKGDWEQGKQRTDVLINWYFPFPMFSLPEPLLQSSLGLFSLSPLSAPPPDSSLVLKDVRSRSLKSPLASASFCQSKSSLDQYYQKMISHSLKRFSQNPGSVEALFESCQAVLW